MTVMAARIRTILRALRAEWVWVSVVSAMVLATTIVIVLWLYFTTPVEYQYSGFIYSWDDGSSYLATMREGMRGAWLYTLPYSADPGQSFPLFVHYIFLGHVSAWLRLEPIVVYHLARLAGGALLLASLYRFISRFCAEVRERRLAFLLVVCGSGFGWLALPLLRRPTPDLWQMEVFPYLSILANVHFPWAMSAFLWLIDSLTDEGIRTDMRDWMRLTIGVMLVSVLQPYGLVIVGLVSAVWLGVRGWRERGLPRVLLMRFVVVGFLGGLFALYYRWMLQTIPSFAAWDKQDVTTSPPPGEYLVAGGVILPLALAGLFQAVRRIRQERDRNALLLSLWAVISCALIYLPVGHQRRFAFALMIPVAILAVQGLTQFRRLNTNLIRAGFVMFASLTNIFLLLIAFIAAQAHPSNLFFTRSEWNGLMYLRRSPPDGVVLSSPEMGLFIPAWADQRVVYGHPNETLDAATNRELVIRFFQGMPAHSEDWLNAVDYIYVGPRERRLGSPAIPPVFKAAFVDGDVTIYVRQR